jgi:hypothetical protein
VAAVAVMRDAGWFDAVKFSTQDLARAAQAAWRSYEREDIPLAAAEVYWRLLVLDSARTWSDDVDAVVRPGDGIYTHMLGEVSRIRGQALGWLRDASEDWRRHRCDNSSGRLRSHDARLDRPGLHELGFTGTGSRWFTCRHGDYEALFSTQKSRYSTRHEVEFWVHLTAVHVPTNSVYWTAQLAGLMPGETHPSHWTVRADSPVDAVAEHLLRAFRRYGWPAIQAALDSPGYPPDPAVSWPRTFPPQPTPAALGDAGPDLGGLTWALRRTGQRDDLFRDLGDADERVRSGAVADIGRAADSDPAVVAALLSRLEHDRSPLVRSKAAAALRPLARQARVGSALQAAASQDEDYEVRWAARYALRLADLAGQSSA